MGRLDIGGARLPRDRMPLTGFRTVRCFYIGLNDCRAVLPGVPQFGGDYIANLRLGTSIGLIPLNGIDVVLTLLLFSVFREPRPTKIPWIARPLLAPFLCAPGLH
jgi:hypothetical protein